jgi:hypothetical protein
MSPTIRCLSAETSNRYLCFGAVSRSARAHASPSQSILKPLMLRAINVVHRDRQLYHAIAHGISAIVLCPKGDWFPNFLGNDLPACCVEKIAWQVTPPATPTNLPSKFSPVGPPSGGVLFFHERASPAPETLNEELIAELPVRRSRIPRFPKPSIQPIAKV